MGDNRGRVNRKVESNGHLHGPPRPTYTRGRLQHQHRHQSCRYRDAPAAAAATQMRCRPVHTVCYTYVVYGSARIRLVTGFDIFSATAKAAAAASLVKIVSGGSRQACVARRNLIDWLLLRRCHAANPWVGVSNPRHSRKMLQGFCSFVPPLWGAPAITCWGKENELLTIVSQG